MSRYINFVLNVIATMAMLSGFLPMLSWSRLEGVPVPNHFNLHGVVDGVGDRGILLTLALIGLGIYIIMILAQCFPKVVNLPVPARKAEAARAAKTDLAAQMNLLLCLLLSLPAPVLRSQLHTLGGRRQDADAEYVVHLGDSGPDAGLHRHCHFPHLPQITYFE